MGMLLSVYLIAEFQYPVGIRIPFHVQEVALAVLEAGQPLDLSPGCRLDFLVGLQSVGLDGSGVVLQFPEDHLFAARTVVVEKIGQPEMCGQDYPDVALSYSLAGKGIRKGYIWVILAAHLGLTYFFYDNGSRSEEVILRELENYSGTIQSDGLKAYKKVEATSGGKVKRLACLQHCKRDFLDMKGNPDADRILKLCNEIYRKEHAHRIGEKGWTAEGNLKWRQKFAPPILKKLKKALLKVQAQTDKYPPTSQMHKAANYFLNEWSGIEAIPTAGDYSWDNNQIERINRYVSLSRKNSLFFGSHAGAERGCVFYSLACSCRLHHINCFEYLSDLLNRMSEMPNGTPVEAYRNLLPDKRAEKKHGE